MKTSTKQSSWVRGFLAVLFFQLGLALPLHTQASIQDILVTVGKLGPVLNTYIKPLKLEWLAPLEQALTTCKFGSDIEITQCADKILSSDAAKDLGGAQAGQIKSMLEIYLDVREGDIGELFNDVIQLAAGQSPLDLACSVVTIVAGGFPVCDVLKALYEVAKAAYEVGKAIVGALADIACGIYEFFGGSCGSTRKVGSVEFIAISFSDVYPKFPVSLQARVGSTKTWNAHKKEVFEKTQAPHLSLLNKAKSGAVLTWEENNQIYLYTDANLEAAWTFYTSNTVYPEWDKLVVSKLIPLRATTIKDAVNPINNEAFRAKIVEAAEKHRTSNLQGSALAFLANSLFNPLLQPALESCEKNDAIAAENLREWVALGRGTPAQRNLVSGDSCRESVAKAALPRPDCSHSEYQNKLQGSCGTPTSHHACIRIADVIGAANLLCTVASGSVLAKEIQTAEAKNANKATLTTLKAPCVDIACGTQITQMWQRCTDGKGPFEGSGEFAPQTNRDEACAKSYDVIYKLAAGQRDITAHLDAERDRTLSVSCKDKVVCATFIAKEYETKTTAFSKFKSDTLAKLLEFGVLRSSANTIAKTTIDTIAIAKQEKIILPATLVGNIAVGTALNLGTGAIGASSNNPPAPALLQPPSPALPKPPVPVVVAPPSGLALGLGLAAKPINIDGCSLFLGRTTELLCNTDRSFNECKPFVDSGKLQSCRRTGLTVVYKK